MLDFGKKRKSKEYFPKNKNYLLSLWVKKQKT